MTSNTLPVSHSPAEGEHRLREPRALTMLIVAKLVVDGGEGLCRVRNISSTGLMMETRFELYPGQEVAVELRNQQTLAGTVVWTRDGRAGVNLFSPVSVQEVLSTQNIGSRVRRCRQPRSPRVTAQVPIEVRIDDRSFEASLHDISQGGLKITLPFKPSLNDKISLVIPGLPLKLGMVRWIGAQVGLEFAEPLPFDLLSRWLHARTSLQRTGP